MLARQRQEAILGEVDRIGGVRVADLLHNPQREDLTVILTWRGAHSLGRARPVDVPVTDAALDTKARRIVSEQVGRLIVAQRFDGEADNKPRKVKNS